MVWPYDVEVPAVQSGDLVHTQSFGRRDDGGVHGAQWQIAVASNEFGDTQPVGGGHRLDGEHPRGQVTEETHLGFRAKTCAEQISHLGDDQNGNDQWPRVGLKKVQRRRVVGIIGIDVGVQRPGVDDQRGDGAVSAARISSMRSEMSGRPLRPAPAAPNLRRLPDSPRWASMASRLISEIVALRRSAS